jgi:hypothetical protein
MPQYAPRLVGDPRFPRFVIVRRPERSFWTGRGWTRRLDKALLFADIDEVNRGIARLFADLLR